TARPDWQGPAPLVQRAAESQERDTSRHEQKENKRPDIGPDFPRTIAFKQDSTNDPQEMRGWQNFSNPLRPNGHSPEGKRKTRQKNGGKEEKDGHLHRLELVLGDRREGIAHGQVGRDEEQ